MKQKIQNVGKFLRWTPWQVKLSMLVMGLGQLCYGQIVKGLFYLACFGLILTYSSQQDLQILLASLRWEPMKRICGWESQAITVLRC